jgi:adenosylhomocysteine nucleosidase
MINFPAMHGVGLSMDAISARLRRYGGMPYSGISPLPPHNRVRPLLVGDPDVGSAAAMPPVIAVTCLAFETRIASGPEVAVLDGHAPKLTTAIERAIKRGCRGIISFGIAGGLAPHLAPGDWIVASGVVTDGRRYPTDRSWSQELLRALPGALHADIAGAHAPVVDPVDKRVIRDATAAVAVDMESHIAADVAQAHGLPFAACRVIIDPAHRRLPPAALVRLRPDGTPDLPAVLWSLIRRPSQLPGLLRIAADARAARASLGRGRRGLGAGLGFPDFPEVRAEAAE